jgi:hypothetical protein
MRGEKINGNGLPEEYTGYKTVELLSIVEKLTAEAKEDQKVPYKKMIVIRDLR